MRGKSAIDAALEPVRAALLSAARDDARRVADAAAAAAARTLEQARRQAAAISAEARAQGEADAAAIRAAAQADARRRARTEMLRAQRDGYLRLRELARSDLARLREDPGYAAIRAALARAISRTLGGDAVIRDTEGGGVLGETADRRIDCSLPNFADRAVDEFAGELFDEGVPAGPATVSTGGSRP